MEAQRFADDFDGIVAGAPAYNWSHLFAGFLWNERALLDDPKATIPAAKLPAIQKAVLGQCDALDGVKDGLLEDPRACHFNPAVLTCKGADSDECLTAPQVAALAKIYTGPRNPRTGVQIMEGFPPGVEGEPGTWSYWIVPTANRTPAQFMFANTYFGQAVYEDPKWDFRASNFDEDVRYADEKAGAVLNSNNPDLRSFRDRGGKLIQYHGWGDAAIPATSSIAYYEKVKDFMSTYPDGRSSSAQPLDNFYRLFMVPGMGHCGGGNGPNTFGNHPGAPVDPEHDVVAALEQWVEKGVAPKQLIGTGKVSGDSSATLTRPLCAYPQTARYNGTGDTNRAANFTCK
jgi:feruloyl esterase